MSLENKYYCANCAKTFPRSMLKEFRNSDYQDIFLLVCLGCCNKATEEIRLIKQKIGLLNKDA